MLLDKFDAFLLLVQRHLRPLAAWLRPLALYRLLVLAVFVATVRAVLLAVPVLQAADAAERQAVRLDSELFHATWLGTAAEAEFARTEEAPRTRVQELRWSQAMQAHTAYVQARRAGYLTFAEFGAWSALLLLLASIYLSENVLGVLLPTSILIVLVGLLLAYWPEVQVVGSAVVHELTRLLSEPAYVPVKWVLVLGLVLGAGLRDVLRRRRPVQLLLGPASLSPAPELVPVAVPLHRPTR